MIATIYEADEWVVYAWRCATEKDARRHATHLHDKKDRDEFVKKWRMLDYLRQGKHGDAAAAAAIISSGYATPARRQPTSQGQYWTAAQILRDSLVPALIRGTTAALLLGSVNGPWNRKVLPETFDHEYDPTSGKCAYDWSRVYAWRCMQSDDVAGVALAPDGSVLPITIGWERVDR